MLKPRANLTETFAGLLVGGQPLHVVYALNLALQHASEKAARKQPRLAR